MQDVFELKVGRARQQWATDGKHWFTRTFRWRKTGLSQKVTKWEPCERPSLTDKARTRATVRLPAS